MWLVNLSAVVTEWLVSSGSALLTKRRRGKKGNQLWKEELTHWDLNFIFIKLSKREVKGNFVFHGDEVSCAHTVGQVLC